MALDLIFETSLRLNYGLSLESKKNRRGPGFMGDNADLPHSGAGFNNHRGGRGMMNRGRGYGRSFEEGRRDNYGDVDRRRDGGYMDRGGPLRGGHQGGGRYMAGDNRGFRGMSFRNHRKSSNKI